MSDQAPNENECKEQQGRENLPHVPHAVCDLSASARSPLADTSSSLLGKWLKALWHRVLGRNTGRSANCLLLNGGKLPPPPGLRCHVEMKRSWERAWQWDCLRKEGFGDTCGMTHLVCPDTVLQSSTSTNYPVGSQLGMEAIAGITQHSSGDFSKQEGIICNQQVSAFPTSQ